jgi:DNA replicative helicase MCM subunit Mcm2 (Cdc46/Mcm family)
LVEITVVLCKQVLAGTGIQGNLEESGEICRNPGQMQEFTGTCENICKQAENQNFLTPAKRRFLERDKTRIQRNPEESWAGTKNRVLEMDIPDIGAMVS